MSLPPPPADILLQVHRQTHVVYINGRRYDVTWQSADGFNKYYLRIVGEKELIDPHTKWSVHKTVRRFDVDINPCGRLGKKILAVLGKTPANFGY